MDGSPKMLGVYVIVATAALCVVGPPATQPLRAAGPDAQLYEQTVSRAIDYLRAHGQAPDGSFSAEANPAITALVATALLRHGRTPDDPLVAGSLKYLEQFIQQDGGIYQPRSLYQNYETSVAPPQTSTPNRSDAKNAVVDAERSDCEGTEIQREVNSYREDSRTRATLR